MFETPNVYERALKRDDVLQSRLIDEPALRASGAWTDTVQQLLADISEAGFRAYGPNLDRAMLEGMRRNILETLGLLETDLLQMDDHQRHRVERIVDWEIRERLFHTARATAPNSRVQSADARQQHFKNAIDGAGELSLFLDLFEPTAVAAGR